jgi:putative phage-type endonuclease
MLTPEIKELRKSGIGGSDASAIAGHNKYKNAVDVYLVKIGDKDDKDIIDSLEDLRSDPRYWGHVLEPIVAAQYEKFEGEKVLIEPLTLRHPEYTWMIANIDRRIVGKNAILECKTASEYKYTQWGEEYTDQMPDEYLFQCMHYAIVADADYVDCAVLIGGNKFKCYRYERDKETEQLLIELEHDFWHNHVLKRIPPPAKTYADTCKLWKKSTDATKTLPSELIDHLKSLNFVRDKIKELEEQLDYDKAKICDFMQESSILLSPAGMKLATWKEQVTTRLDINRLKKEREDIYQEYAYTVPSRVLRVKEFK